jgi:serine/threonine-protein kinase
MPPPARRRAGPPGCLGLRIAVFEYEGGRVPHAVDVRQAHSRVVWRQQRGGDDGAMRDVPPQLEGVYEFGPFRLDPISRTLSHAGTRVWLAPRLFDTLLHLVESRGRLVSRDELMQAVWPARTVDQTSLGMAVSSLRTALKQHGAADNLIITAPGRGYRFGARVTFTPHILPDPDPMPAALPAAAARPPPPAVAGWRGRRVALPLAALALGLAAFGLVRWQAAALRAPIAPRVPAASMPPAFTPPPHSIAVLPFTNMSGTPNDDYFAEGLSEELINALGRSGALRVAAGVSSFSFRNRPATVTEIARQLNVGLLLEGSVRRTGTRVRVIAQLIDAITGFQVWSQSYDRAPGDMLALQGDIAAACIASLKLILLPNEVARLTLGGTTDPRAFDAYLSGLPHATDSDDDGERQAIAAFSRAIALDPHYALAYAERARALAYLGANGVFTDVAASHALMAASQRDADQAVALAPELGEAHAALGFVLKCRLSDLARAGAEYRRATELAPGDATILLRYALFELVLGHFNQAVEAAEHAASLDPLAPKTYRTLARILAYARRFDDAHAALRHARGLLPADPGADRTDLAFVQMMQGDVEGARQSCGAEHDPHFLTCVAWVDHALGRQADAEAAFAGLRAAIGDNGAYLYANMMADWGRTAEALTWLQTAYRLRDPGLIDMRIDPLIGRLRDTPQFKQIEASLGFPP